MHTAEPCRKPAQRLHMCGNSCALPRQTASGAFTLLLNISGLHRQLLAHHGRPEADAALAAATPSVTVASVSHSRRSQYGLSAPAAAGRKEERSST